MSILVKKIDSIEGSHAVSKISGCALLFHPKGAHMLRKIFHDLCPSIELMSHMVHSVYAYVQGALMSIATQYLGTQQIFWTNCVIPFPH